MRRVLILFSLVGVLLLIALAAAAFGFIDIPAGASKAARVVFYLILTILLLVLVAGMILVKKATALARGFGINLSWKSLVGILRFAQFLRSRR